MSERGYYIGPVYVGEKWPPTILDVERDYFERQRAEKEAVLRAARKEMDDAIAMFNRQIDRFAEQYFATDTDNKHEGDVHTGPAGTSGSSPDAHTDPPSCVEEHPFPSGVPTTERAGR